ncbi:YceD family protein [Corynebacterium alimapuense]|uniref:DNA-binding protein n=1 Tax=Corynebacterium alimapuense TaxID=1576874 RepID=A0A3M8K891_9CORY|nr:YceD family protein [Corynebacterium alimapuense]RNE49441.1 DNA-binding protein [Corynebacterium alimapuense]
MTSPFLFHTARLADFDQRTQTGPSPTRIGPEMIGIPEGGEVTVEATLTSLGGGVLINADVHAVLSGECVRCLRSLHPTADLHVSQVFSFSADFITGEAADDAEEIAEEVPLIVNEELDLLQTVINEAGLSLPFNPTCGNGCDDGDTPAPDGVSGEDEGKLLDPRWADLEKFL